MPLQLAADQHVELLIGAANLEIGFERDRVVSLDNGIKQFVQEQRLLGREPLLEIVALENTGDAHLGGNLDQTAYTEVIHPFAVETDLGQVAIENLERLVAIGIGVALDLFARQRLARLGSAGRIANHRGEVADQENYGVARVLKIAQLLEREGVTQMQVGRGRIHPELDPERTAERNFCGKLRLRNQFGGPTSERRRLLIRFVFVYGPLRQFRSPTTAQNAVMLKRTGILTPRNSPRRSNLSAIHRLAAPQMRPVARRDASALAHNLQLAAANHSQLAQPSFHDAKRMLVDHAHLTQPELAMRKPQAPHRAGVRIRSPPHAEAGRCINFAE